MKHRSFFFLLFASALFLSGCKQEAPDTRAILKINSEPADATVTILKKEVGKTPFGCKIRPGNYLVKLSKENYSPMWLNVSLKPKQELKLAAKLEPLTTSILFETIPSGASVLIKNKFAGETPFILKDVAPGDYSAILKLPGYSPKTVHWNVASARPQRIRNTLVSNVGSLDISSEPNGAAVLLNGSPAGKTPYQARLEQGKYTVSVSKNGFTKFEQIVLVNKNKTSFVKATLDPLPGTLSIKTTPSGASVRINGKDYGRTPLNVNQLSPGTYQVELSANGYDPVNLQVNLAGGQTAERSISLQGNTGGIDLVTYPAGVTIYLDGKELGTSIIDSNNPPYSKVFSIQSLTPGKHLLTLAHKRARPNKKTIAVTIEKGRTERLNNLTMWIANSVLKMKDGKSLTGRLVAKKADGKIMFDLEPGVTVTYKPEEIVSITPIKEEE